MGNVGTRGIDVFYSLDVFYGQGVPERSGITLAFFNTGQCVQTHTRNLRLIFFLGILFVEDAVRGINQICVAKAVVRPHAAATKP